MSKKRFKMYSDAFKWRVVHEVISGKLNKEEARKAYGIRSKSAIVYWMRKFSGNAQYRTNKNVGIFADMPKDNEINELKEKIAQLERELRTANLRADLWQQMIEVAEKNLHIDIKKKPGAQPLKPLSKTKKRLE
jgi:transposase